MTDCASCRYYLRLQHGAVGICLFEWRDLKWNDAVPLKLRDQTCREHTARVHGECQDKK